MIVLMNSYLILGAFLIPFTDKQFPHVSPSISLVDELVEEDLRGKRNGVGKQAPTREADCHLL